MNTLVVEKKSSNLTPFLAIAFLIVWLVNKFELKFGKGKEKGAKGLFPPKRKKAELKEGKKSDLQKQVEGLLGPDLAFFLFQKYGSDTIHKLRELLYSNYFLETEAETPESKAREAELFNLSTERQTIFEIFVFYVLESKLVGLETFYNHLAGILALYYNPKSQIITAYVLKNGYKIQFGPQLIINLRDPDSSMRELVRLGEIIKVNNIKNLYVSNYAASSDNMKKMIDSLIKALKLTLVIGE